MEPAGADAEPSAVHGLVDVYWSAKIVAGLLLVRIVTRITGAQERLFAHGPQERGG